MIVGEWFLRRQTPSGCKYRLKGMPAYNLRLLIDAADLPTIQSVGLSVVLARAFSDASSNVAWASFAPFEQNTVSWDNVYGLYAAASVSSSRIQPQSTTALGIPSGMYYNFGGSFAGPFAGDFAPAVGSYRVVNKIPSAQSPTFVFGLAQSVTSNGILATSNPATMATVPANFFATFTPLDTVYVWLQTNAAPGNVVQVPPPLAQGFAPGVSGGSTTVQFNTPSTLTYRYSATVGGFLPSA